MWKRYELRALIRRISIENSLWGAPRFHGELLKLGFELAQSSFAKYMVKRREPPNQGWRTFLRYTQRGRGHVLPFRRTNPLLIMTQLVWRATGRCAATAHHRP